MTLIHVRLVIFYSSHAHTHTHTHTHTRLHIVIHMLIHMYTHFLTHMYMYTHTRPPVFHRLTGDQAVLQKMVYVLGNLLGIALGVYKCNSMGLLPTAQSDWLEFMAARQVRMNSYNAYFYACAVKWLYIRTYMFSHAP